MRAPTLGPVPPASGWIDGVLVAVRDLGARLLRPREDDERAECSVSGIASATAFEPRGYSLTVDAHPYERRDGRWVVGDVTVRVCFYCSTSTHLLSWPDGCTFESAADASRSAYDEARRWALVRYG